MGYHVVNPKGPFHLFSAISCNTCLNEFIIFSQMMTWWFTTFMAPAIKQKVHSLPGVEYLYSAMSPHQLEIPAFITEYDMTVRNILKANFSNSYYILF